MSGAAGAPATPHAGLAGKRVLLVTPEILGPIRNGGIGTQFTALALLWQRAGAEVTVAFVDSLCPDAYDYARWRDHYAGLGIRLVAINEASLEDLPSLEMAAPRARAWLVHHWLEPRAGEFDLAVFADWLGLAFFVVAARRQGIAYRHLPVMVNAQGPGAWVREGNRAFASSVDDVEMDFMERECARRADWLVCPSAYVRDWMVRHGWELAANTVVIQNHVDGAPRDVDTAARRPVAEVVFFGRLERRKGLHLFCGALDRLDPEVRRGIPAIRFFGRAPVQDGFDPLAFLAERSRNWGVPVDIRTDLDRDAALAALSRPGVLAVMPSESETFGFTVVECLHHGVPFLANNTGAIPELVAPEDRAECLFEPTPASFAGQLSRALAQGQRPARRAVGQDAVRDRWLDWAAEAIAAGAGDDAGAPPPGPDGPLVTICLTHYERPARLAEGLASIRAQTYRRIEVVLVDDGSRSPEALAMLEGLEPEFAARGWTLLRQENAYVSAARNAAAAAAKGDYLLFMDDDNLAVPEEIETFLAVALHTGCDVATCISPMFDGDMPPAKPRRLWVPLGAALGAGIYRSSFGDTNAFWKRSAFVAVGGFTTDYGVTREDIEILGMAMFHGMKVEMVPRGLFWYRISGTGLSATTDHAINRARGMRPYFERAPFGLGAAISHASYLQSRDDLHRRTAQELEELRQRYRRLERRARIPFAVPLGDLADGIARFARNVLRRRQR